MESIRGLDNWIIGDYDDGDAEYTCGDCGCEIPEVIAEESGICEDCECSEDCEGCVHCLSVAGYEALKAEGNL